MSFIFCFTDSWNAHLRSWCSRRTTNDDESDDDIASIFILFCFRPTAVIKSQRRILVTSDDSCKLNQRNREVSV